MAKQRNGAAAPTFSMKTGRLCDILDGATLKRDPREADFWGETSKCLDEFFALMKKLFDKEELRLPIPITMNTIVVALIWIPKKKEHQGKVSVRQQQVLSRGFKILQEDIDGKRVLASITKHLGVAVAAE